IGKFLLRLLSGLADMCRSNSARWETMMKLARQLAAFAVGTLFASAAYAAEPLVTADWVAENLENPKVRVFEVSVDTGVYERGHIPGAVNLNWHTDPVDPVKRDIAQREAFEAVLRDAGVDKDTTIGLYGDNNNR